MNTNGQRMVKLTSTDSGRVIVHEPAFSVHREFPGKGTSQVIPFDVVEQLMWRTGFKNMIMSGTLYIADMQDKIDLGLEEPDTKEPTRIKVLNDQQILTLLKVSSYDKFVNELSTLPSEQINNIITYAVDNEIIDPQKDDYLKKLTGRDILKMITHKRDQEEAEIAAKVKEENRRKEGEFNAI